MIIEISDSEVFIDECDVELFKKYIWHIHGGKNTDYLRGYIPLKRKDGLKYFHRLVLDTPRDREVDHINGNGLDNRRNNLRICTRSQNNANRKVVQSKTSSFKGVHFEACTKKWRAEITCNNVHYRLGRFLNQDDALKAYKNKALELFGEYAS